MTDSWGNISRPEQTVYPLSFRNDALPDQRPFLPIGMRRSYGDVCTNHNGSVLDTTSLSRFICYDKDLGVVRCESGVTLWEVLNLTVPHGWFLPVTPGTSFVTLGGAVANDVHGKNHHVAGSFGCFVRQFKLRRTDGSELICSRENNADLFAATVGGLGLTGVITWVELDLKSVSDPTMDVESIEYANFKEFLSLSRESEQSHEYHVSWVDCLGRGAQSGRGVFFRANHNTERSRLSRGLFRSRWNVPGLLGKAPPLINPLTLRAFNVLYRYRNRGRKSYIEPAEKYFYPLDGLLAWNRIYGRRGFYQFQCVVPFENSEAISELLVRIEKSGQGSFLSVMKTMGSIRSPGLLAFSRPGITLALDFPNGGDRTLGLMKSLEATVVEADGAIYPAKDAVMSSATFKAGYPNYSNFEQYLDPGICSDFWRRVFH